MQGLKKVISIHSTIFACMVAKYSTNEVSRVRTIASSSQW